MSYPIRSSFYLLIQLCLLVNVLASPYPHNHAHLDFQNRDEPAQLHLSARAIGWLRIMPLGASITYGQRGDGNSSTHVSHDGYRKPLRDQLRSRGYDVNMIGCQSTGQMRDRQHEGHPGFMIAEVRNRIPCAINQKPNLVLINVGTNDCLQGDKHGGATFVQGAQGRMKTMVDEILNQVKDVTVIVSTLLPNKNTKANSYVNTVNAGYRQLVSSYQSSGKKVQLADMNTGWLKVSEMPDGTHPNDGGYKKMAAVWDAAIEATAKKGWIKDPINTGKPDSEGFYCDTTPSSFSSATQTQRGSGADDGTYAHASTSMGTLTTDSLHEKSDSATKGQWVKNYHFAQLVNGGGGDRGQETDELIRVLDSLNPVADSGLPAFSFKSNNGGTVSSGWTAIDVKQFCNNRGVRWGDVNNDGLDDMICIGTDGSMSVSINKGGNPPTFNYIGKVKTPEDTQARVRLGDIDGDGRLDYCVVKGQGDLYCWRNGGTADTPAWEPMVGGIAFDAKNLGDIAGIRLVDINGDSRSDVIHVSANGKTRIFINQRGTKEDGPGLKPHWVEASNAHAGGIAATADHVKFGRLYGSGRADYIVVKESNVKDSLGWKHTYSFDVWKNTGSGGRKVKGDGVFYCDMYGRGHDDYLWVYESGSIHLFENTGNVPNWKQHNEIFNTGRDRKSLHFSDWDGDGLCDILAVDKRTGSADWWQNSWKKGQSVPTFAYQGQAIAGNCNYRSGVSRYDLSVRFADVDGDGRDDYLCMDPSGTTTAVLNKEKGLTSVGQIKYSVGKDRADHRFVDVDADGKADFLALDKFTGDVTVYINKGQKKKTSTLAGTGDSSFEWAQQNGLWMGGVDRGANMFFAQMSNSSGRVDFIRNLPASDTAYTYFNLPCKAGGDDPTSSLPLPKPS